MFDPGLVDRIFEAGALPERWPGVLETIADAVNGAVATFVMHTDRGVSIMTTPRTERVIDDYFREGWADDPEYGAPLLGVPNTGFHAETRWRSLEEIERLPVHAEFLTPRGYAAGVGAMLAGMQGARLQMAVEGIPSHREAEKVARRLNHLVRPLERALNVTTLLRGSYARTAVDSLDLAGVAAAVVSPDGRLRAANGRFLHRLGDRMVERPSGLRFLDRALHLRFAEALTQLEAGATPRSIALTAADTGGAAVLHLLPLRGGARDVFGWDGVLILLAEAATASVPGADLLRLLFDLTPAEARLARLLLQGSTPAEAAAHLQIAEGTARTHLRRIFAKTGVQRQSQLVHLLLGLGAP